MSTRRGCLVAAAQLRSIALRLVPLAALPAIVMAQGAPVGTCADFETGTLPSFITAKFTSSPPANGCVQVTMAFPFSRLWALDLDTDCDNCGGSDPAII